MPATNPPPTSSRNHRTLFLGRKQELDWLRAAWDATLADGPQFRILTAESGYGKTKIAQAFYTWLSTERDPDHYWPDTLLHEGKDLRVMPDMTGVQHATKIPWFWWGLRWENPGDRNRMGQTSPFISSRHDPSFLAHEEALLADVHTRNACIKAVIAIGKTGLSMIPGADLVSNLVQAASDIGEAVNIAREHREHTQASAIDASTEKAIDEILHSFTLLLDRPKGEKTSLPVVLLLDDAQWLDPLSLEILRRLWRLAVAKHFPLLVFATHWQKEWNENFQDTSPEGSFARWILELQNPPPDTPDSSRKLEVLKLGKLTEVRELLAAEFSGLSEEQTSFLCEEAAGNPRHISELIELLKRKPDWFTDRDFTKALTPKWKDFLSKEQLDLQKLESERFDSIAEHLRQLLGIASLQGDRFLRTFTLEVTLEVAENLAFRSDSVSDTPLDEAENPHALVEALDAISMEFRSRNIRKCAASFLEQSGKDERVATVVALTTREWVKSKKLDELPIEFQFCLRQISSLEAEKKEDIAAQVFFHATALQKIQESGIFFYASDWIASWERLSPNAKDLFSCDFWLLRDTALLFQKAGKKSLAESLVRELENHPKTKGDNETPDASMAKAAWLQISGDLLHEAGATKDALARYLKSLELREQIRAQFGEWPGMLRDISSSLDRVGDVEREQGQTESALKRYRQSLELSEQIRAQFGDSPDRLRDISVSLDRIADVEVSLGQTESALARYLKSLEIAEQLRTQFGDSPDRLCDISVSLGRIADVEVSRGQTKSALARYLESLEIREQLRTQFGDSPDRLRDISVSLIKIADVEVSLGQTESALARYLKSLVIREQLRTQFGDSPERLRDISVSLDRVANVEVSRGQTEIALKRYRESLEIREQLRTQFGDSPDRLRDISVSHYKLSTVFDAKQEFATALFHAERALAFAQQIVEFYGSTPQRMKGVAFCENLVSDCKEKKRP